MEELQEYVGVQRCRTWNVWPEVTALECRDFALDYGAEELLPARVAILCYDGRVEPHNYRIEETERGPLVWDGTMIGLYLVRDVILKAPGDVAEISLKHRNARRGEIDICVNFKFAGELPSRVIEAVRSTASAVMALVNLEFKDFLVPSAPFSVHLVRPSDGGKLATTMVLLVEQRHTITKDQLRHFLGRITSTLAASSYGPKLTVALELYAAYLAEKDVRVRFLLLVVAMEALAKPTQKDQAALEMLDRWQQELAAAKRQFPPESESWLSLDALGRELSFRREDSIRSQVRKLFSHLPGADPDKMKALQRRALRVYDKRSVLVHEGVLPGAELDELEAEARVLLDVLLSAAIAEQESGVSGAA